MSKTAACFGLKIGLPYLDREIIEFLSELPEETIHHSGVHCSILHHSIAKHLPEVIRSGTPKTKFNHWNSARLKEEFEVVSQFLTPNLEIIRQGILPRKALADAQNKKIAVNIYALELWVSAFTTGFFSRLRELPTDTVVVKESRNAKFLASPHRDATRLTLQHL